MPDQTHRDPTGKDREFTTGGANTGGFPDPGGEIDANEVTPLSHDEGRTSGPGTNESTRERTESVERQLSGDQAKS